MTLSRLLRQYLAVIPVVLIVLGCSSQKNETSYDSTSIEAIDSVIETETASAAAEEVSYTEEETSVTEPGDSTWLKAFTRDPLGLTSYEGVKDFLKQNNIEYKDTVINDENTLLFGNSKVSLNVTEAYGDLVCSAYIEHPSFPLKGIDIGMSREDFFKTSGLVAEKLSRHDSDKYSYSFSVDEGDYTWYTTFYFDETTLTALDYSVSSCIIYD